MDFWQYILQWGARSFQLPWSAVQSFLLVWTISWGIIAAKRPRWSVSIKRITWIWLTPLAIFVGVLIPSLMVSSYNIYLDLYREYATYAEQMTNDVNTLRHKVLILQKANAIPYDNHMPIQIKDSNILLPRDIGTIRDRVFNNCSFFCNDNYVHFTNCTLDHCTAEGIYKFITIPASKSRLRTTITFVDCVMVRCSFSDVNIIGDEKEIVEYQTNINSK